MTNKQEIASIVKPVPVLYYIGLVSFILFFMEIELAWRYPTSIFKYISIISLAMHLLTVMKEYKPIQLITLSALFILTLYVGYNAQQITLLCLSFFLIVGAKGMDLNAILHVHFLTGLILFLVTVIGCAMGLIENKVDNISVDSMEMLGTSSSKRYSYGFAWSTDCAIHLSFVCLVYWLMKEGILKGLEILIFTIAFIFCFQFVKARQASFIILMLIMTTFYLKYLWKRNLYPYKIILYLLVVSIPFFSIISMYATISYDNTDIFWIATDILFSGRLGLGEDAITYYGVPWFGQYVQMIGGDANTLEYNYVDSSYVQAYLLWGIVLTTILILVYFVISKKAYQRRDIPLLFAIFFAGLSSVTSQDLFQLYHCPFLIALLSNHQIHNTNYEKRRTETADFGINS